ncbi:polysaccharide biosynthesis tyrosine autokinase [Serratia proteamaculans]|uniref:polysaccharide biosynthesis tyrosine autokinase n=1 Tax=Serratia proteamaculans TaxID=28151 RepID=UPI0039B034B1
MSTQNKIKFDSKESNEEIDLSRLFSELLLQKWFIIGVSALFATLSLVYVIFATPIYQSSALIQVESNTGNSLLKDISSMLPDGSQKSDTEIELIQSRLVMGRTIEQLNLTTYVEPKHFPIFGAGWARLMNAEEPEVSLSKLSVPQEMLNTKLVLVVLAGNKFELKYDGDTVLSGAVGVFAEKNGFSILVSDINAKEGTEFTVIKRSELNVLAEMQRNLSVADKGKDTGVLGLTYTGADPKEISAVLNSISQNYLQQNVDRKSEEAGKSLNFLEQQLPKIRQQLDDAESKLNSFRQQKDSVDLSLEAKSLLDSVVNVESQLNQLTLKEAEISQLYTKEHPAYLSLIDKRKMLIGERKKLDAKISKMPETQQEILRLTRDVQAGQEIYMAMLNKQQELGISKASTIGNVRIIDDAITTPKPVSPKKEILVVLITLFGFFLSSGIILIRIILHKAIQSPDQLEEIGVNVYASIPISDYQQKRDLLLQRRKHKNSDILLAQDNPADLAIEAIRSLRTSLHFAMMEAKNNVLMISGASPSIGKTFICTNLAAIIAQSGSKVLMIDADMRRGRIHEVLNTSNSMGLSAYLSGQKSRDEVVIKTTIPDLDFIPRGKVPPNPAELLMRKHFAEIIEWASENYDMVLVDSPPVLAVTDPAIIGALAGTNMLVTRYGVTTLKEVDISMRRFENSGVEIKGVILNAQEKRTAGYYGYYNYNYASTKE